jgi:hypothetical protein
MLASRQPHRELGEVAYLAVDRDRAAVLLGDDLVADRQAKSGTFAGRLGRKEWLEQFLAMFRWNANSVVAHPNLDAFAKVAGHNSQLGAKSAVDLAGAPVNGVESVADQIKEHAGYILRHNLDRRESAVEIEPRRTLTKGHATARGPKTAD